MSETVNLIEEQSVPYSILFSEVEKVLAEDNISHVNQHDKKVKPRRSFYTKYGKRIIDIIVSASVLTITLPFNILIAVLTFFDVGMPIFFKQKRVGLNGKEFTLVKFRNMTNAKDQNGELLPPKERVTKLGRFMRKTSLDELLNFWSILKGDMSLIGPRPLLVDYANLYSERHKMRHAVRPGLECPLIIECEARSTWAEQFENDVYYVEHVSFLLDVRMVFLLVQMVFDRKGTKIRGNADRGSFLGYERDGRSVDSRKVPVQYFEKAMERINSKTV